MAPLRQPSFAKAPEGHVTYLVRRSSKSEGGGFAGLTLLVSRSPEDEG